MSETATDVLTSYELKGMNHSLTRDRLRPQGASKAALPRALAGKADFSGSVLEGVHHEPFVQFRIEKVLDAELEDLPEGPAVALVDVDVTEGERKAEELAGRELRHDDADPPVVHVAPRVPLQRLPSDEARGAELL